MELLGEVLNNKSFLVLDLSNANWGVNWCNSSSSCWSIVENGLLCFLWLLRRMGGECVVVINSVVDWFPWFLDAGVGG